MILAFDPGDTTGVCVFKENGDVASLSQLSLSEFLAWAATYEPEEPVTTLVIEDYVLFAKRAVKQSGSRMKASQVIGALKLLAIRLNATVVMQPSSIMPIASKWSQIYLPANHAQSHQIAAFLHGYYWLVQQGRVKTPLQKEAEARNGKEAESRQ